MDAMRAKKRARIKCKQEAPAKGQKTPTTTTTATYHDNHYHHSEKGEQEQEDVVVVVVVVFVVVGWRLRRQRRQWGHQKLVSGNPNNEPLSPWPPSVGPERRLLIISDDIQLRAPVHEASTHQGARRVVCVIAPLGPKAPATYR